MSRRAVLGAGLGMMAAGRALFGESDFWNKKQPAEWTSDEVLLLLTRSPWATTARVLPKQGRDTGSVQPMAPDSGAGNRTGGRGTGPEPVVAVAEVTVRWESARPVLDALKYSFPEDFLNHYVVGIPELPEAPRGRGGRGGRGGRAGSRDVPRDETLFANLRARGREPVDAGAVTKMRDGSTVFGFSKELLPLTGADRDVLFTLEAEGYSLKAKFDPKEMKYRGMVAL